MPLRVGLTVLLVGGLAAPGTMRAQPASIGNAALTWPGPQGRPPAAVLEAAGTIRAAQLRERLFLIADDSFGERHTPSPGLDRASEYIASALADAHLSMAPGLPSYFQKVPYSAFVIDSVRSRLSLNGTEFSYGADFKAGSLSGNSGFGFATGPVVYVGHGLVIPTAGVDAYRGVDVRGKIILAHPEWPRGVPHASWTYPTAYANAHGARGVLLLASYTQLSRWNQRADPSVSGLVGSEEVIRAENTGRVPVLTIGPSALDILLRGERYRAQELFARGMLGDPPPPFDLDSATQVRMSAAYRFEPLGHDPRNVVAILEGRDPVLRSEYVVLGAHYDADVEDPPKGADSVHNGADDNGSGTVALIEIARAMGRAPRPRRSVAFVWFAGEETGRWGSRYFVSHSPFPIERITAYVNLDMIGRSRGANDSTTTLTRPNEVRIDGLRADSPLYALAEAVNRSYLGLRLIHTPADTAATGDAAAFAARHVPVLGFGTGLHREYHEVTDSPDKIDYAKLEKIARTVLAVSWSLADAGSRQQGGLLDDAFVDSLFADYTAPNAPGAAVLVAREGRIVLRKAYGLADVEAHTPVAPGTTFQLASLTKPFTAVAALMLVHDGKLRLDERITDVFPEFPDYGRRVTMRHLLSHTDGLVDGRSLPGARAGETGVLTRLRRIDSVSFPPGSQFRYGNAGYALLAEVIAKRSGMRFGTFLQRRIFGPLGMRSTLVCGDHDPAPRLRAHGYARRDSGWTRAGVPCDPSGWIGAGGVVSSVDDLLKFDQALYTERLLPARVLKDAFTPFTLSDGSTGPFGYGWVVREERGRRSQAHFGSMPGFRTYLTRYPDQRVTIIVLVNRDAEKDSQLPGPLSNRLADRLLGRSIR